MNYIKYDNNFDGVLTFENFKVPFHYDGGNLAIHFDEHTELPENDYVNFIGQKHGMIGGYILFHSPIPLPRDIGKLSFIGETQTKSIVSGTMRQDIDYFIKNYHTDSVYKQMKFSFKELDDFVFSNSACIYDEEKKTINFSTSPKIIESFQFNYEDTPVIFSLQINSQFDLGSKCSAETKTELILEFDETSDINFLLGLYHLIHDIFSFFCNRRNHSLCCVTLSGILQSHSGSVDTSPITTGNRIRITSQELFVIDKFKEEPEKNNSLISFDLLAPSFEKLFDLFLNNQVSIYSIHSSSKSRNLIDLKHSLHVLAAFEYYQKKFLTEISSESTISVYNEIKELLEKYANGQTGKKGRKAKDILDGFKPMISLKDKICKVYDGYSSWFHVRDILREWFGKEILDLATVANEWRNELAHEKREYEPDFRVVAAIRLIEHLNYIIVFRMAGYSDETIKVMLTSVLEKPILIMGE